MQTVRQSSTTWALATWSRALGGVVMACDRDTAQAVLYALPSPHESPAPGLRELRRQIEAVLSEPTQ